jgi:hypothetical protein
MGVSEETKFIKLAAGYTCIEVPIIIKMSAFSVISMALSNKGTC